MLLTNDVMADDMNVRLNRCSNKANTDVDNICSVKRVCKCFCTNNINFYAFLLWAFLQKKLCRPSAMTRRWAPQTRYTLRRNRASITKESIGRRFCFVNTKYFAGVNAKGLFDHDRFHLKFIFPILCLRLMVC